MFVYALSAHDWLIAQLRNFWDCRIPAHTLILSHCSMHPSRIWNRDKRFGSVLSGDELSRTIRNHFGTISVRLKPFKNHLEPLWSVQEPFETISVRQEPSSTKQFHTLHPPQHRNYSILLRFCVLASFLFMFFFVFLFRFSTKRKKWKNEDLLSTAFFRFTNTTDSTALDDAGTDHHHDRRFSVYICSLPHVLIYVMNFSEYKRHFNERNLT